MSEQNKYLDDIGLRKYHEGITNLIDSKLDDTNNYIDTQILAEASVREEGDTHTLDSAKTYTDEKVAEKADSDHNHDFSDIISGILSVDILPIVPVEKGGTGYTTIEDKTYTTVRYRASSLNPTETTPTINGVIAWYYE